MNVGDRVTSKYLRWIGVESGIVDSVDPDGGAWIRNDDNSAGMLLFDRDIDPPIDPTVSPDEEE